MVMSSDEVSISNKLRLKEVVKLVFIPRAAGLIHQ